MPRTAPILTALADFTGRVLIASLFLAGTVQKISDPAPAQALLTGFGLPEVLIWPAALFNALAAAALITGIALRPMALLLAGYCAVTSLFHFIPAEPWQMTIFVKNWAIAGGCLALAAHEVGPWRLRLRRPALGSE